ncbi:TetR family transcriptional regulator [Streptomyces sp. TX20-6-3]|uniref:TetR/AcrR family transcriptional regulator n=1 Tax=Streptomyces sp. TX20-6-3 TaxID=3028705 RepID=UPI0029BB059F|nr:TetR/AcrR family transcriptional regulator [Streptomyces sp. TX20-6-3]MDX2560436.1 TetR family transcriptional regulator [Streptomyces sp. TX20-6-3]
MTSATPSAASPGPVGSPASRGSSAASGPSGASGTSGAPDSSGASVSPASRADRIGDAALDLLVERGMRGLTHRAVDERAGLPQGSTSNHARTRQALLETAVRRQVQLESQVLTPDELPGAAGPGAAEGALDGAPYGAPEGAPIGTDALVDALSLALHRYLTDHRALLVSRYELALEATRRPELRAFFDAAGSVFHGPLVAMTAAAGSSEPERHALSLIAWCEGLMFSCAAGSFHAAVPSRAELRTGFDELLRGMLGGGTGPGRGESGGAAGDRGGRCRA